MAEFVNWDKAEQPSSGPGNMPLDCGPNLDFQPVQDNHDFDLALANIDGDDFSFWALEHFETSNLHPGLGQAAAEGGPAALNLCEYKQAPCDACEASGFDCKRIEEGKCKGCCTTCIALDITCSFVSDPGSRRSCSGLSPPGNVLLEDVQQSDLRSSSSPDLMNLGAGNDSGNDNSPKPPAAPKIGARFSRESVRILKAWLSTHSHRPYPNDEERENLQRQTGLNKTQIANWLANARRRSKGKFQRTRSTSPSLRGYSGAVEIPQRRRTPALDSEYLSPLQRWQNSPPENEPASVTAIASAILQSNPHDSGLNSPFNITDDDAARSCKSSASSFGTSPSSGSFASAYSHGSGGSFGSFQQRGRRRRRRRTVPKEINEKSGLNAPPKTFQCTFCTETFRTKHDWQRHEKSLHLSLERWVCCPKGPRALKSETKQMCCVFCGLEDPDSAHVESHNHTSCQERSLDERTFYRKDHLRQHLKLVHNTKYLQWSMDAWKIPTPDIKSRCGFCGQGLSSWPVRVDHLAEHFKTGSDMRSWKGDWGFEPGVLSMVENAIPPYVIHDERTTPYPFQAGQPSSDSPRNAYELIKLELTYFLQNARDKTGATPSDHELQHEACRIIYASEVLSNGGIASKSSWLRDLLMSLDELSIRAQMGPLRGQSESYLTQLRVIGKDNIFEDCSMEKQLADFVKARTLLGLTVANDELQVEACNIIGRMEESSVMPSEDVANFLLRLIYKDSLWLSNFRQRAGVSVSPDSLGSKGSNTATSTIHNYSQLEHELAEFVKNCRAISGTDPSNEKLREQARLIVYKCQDSWQQTAADNTEWLNAFKQRHFQQQSPQQISSANGSPLNSIDPLMPVTSNTLDSFSNLASTVDNVPGTSYMGSTTIAGPSRPTPADVGKKSHLFLGSSSCYRQLARQLSRFVASTMSPKNPSQHVPTDEEIKHQARWILYDDDDPLNRTAADNPEWLLRFKRSVGIFPAEDGESLPNDLWASIDAGGGNQWPDVNMTLETSAPEAMAPLTSAQPMQLDSGNLDSLDFGSIEEMDVLVLQNPGLVFASRDFEDKLVQFAVAEVASSGRMPADEAIRARAKELSGLEVWQAQPTPAEDPVLLAKFKVMVVDKVRAVLGGGGHDEGAGHHQRTQASTIPPFIHTSDRGLDAIDPGLLPALESGETGKDEVSSTSRDDGVQVAISEERLDEIISEALESHR